MSFYKGLKNNKGQILIQVIVFAVIATLLIGGLTSWAGLTLKAMKQAYNRELAIQIAEAGIEYYRWHLAHVPQDFTDGTGVSGPYIHEYKDKDGIKIGEFSLDITPPPIGSTIVTIRSLGTVLDDSFTKRTIEARLAIPSWAKYAVAANDNMRFGEGTEVFGPIYSNKGIRFDGLAHNIVSSALSSYYDPDHSGGKEFGVHTHAFPTDPLPPNAVPNRSDVFLAGRQFPVPAIDFAGITTDLAQMKADAISAGRYFSASGKSGWHIVLKTNDTFDLYKVTSLESASNSCTRDSGGSSTPGWGTWSIRTETFQRNYPIPSNGIIFAEDNIWINGQISTARVTIAAGRFPDEADKRKSITINNDLTYTNYNGEDVIALVSQKDVNIGMESEDNLRIDGALIAQNGRVGRYYYDDACSPYHERDTITSFGMLGTNQRYGFAYTNGTGYEIRNLIYDSNLLYSPPPKFPLTSDKYEIISWQEVESF